MRKEFAALLHKEMARDSRVYLITADLGYGVLDNIFLDFPERSLNVGASEQLLIGVAVGLAQAGMRPVCYSISPFLLYRPFEIIRNYVEHEGANVKLVGSGRDKDYGHDGFTHWSEDDVSVVTAAFPHIHIYKPHKLTAEIVDEFLTRNSPAYLNLSRF